MSVHWPIIRRCLRSPGRTLVVDDQRSYSGAALLIAALALADDIHRRCQTPTIALMLPTSGVFPIAALAAWIAGKTVVPLNYLLKPEELQFVLDDCGADTVLTVQPMLDFVGAAPRCTNLIRLEDINFRRVPEPRWPATPGDDELAVLLYTSGTSGKPKGVMLTHGNLSANVRQAIDHVQFGPEHIVMGVLPQFHSFGLTVLTLMPLSVGCKVVYTARFMPPRIIKLFREHKPTALIAIPSMYNALLHVKDAGPADFASLRFAVSGGEPLPRAVTDAFFDRYRVRIAEGYGLTETSPLTNWCRPYEYRPGSVGPPVPLVRERIVDVESGRDLPAGMDGEIRIAGPNVMPGYFNRPAETAAAFDDRGFFRTGDIGRMDQDGHLYITGRLKEMLIVAGENVFPREIEEALNSHPSVKDSGVVGMTDPLRGELPLAFVEVKEGTTFDEDALLKHCRERLAGYKVPRAIKRLDALPRGATGKVLRRELKKMA